MLDQIEAEAEAAAPDGATALELLQAVYRDKRNPLHMRMRAASIAIPFETPKLAVTANVNTDIGELLDRAIQRSVERKNVKVIEHRPASED